MKKIGILTINDNNNYGNRLQNYATQTILKNMNIKAETIENIRGNYNKNIINFIKKNIKDLTKKIFFRNKYRRYLSFIKFNKNINYSKYRIDCNHIDKNLKSYYDYFIVGSDQVWNPTFKHFSKIDLLTFVENKKRISFAASFGINELPVEYSDFFKTELSKFKNISVREDAGKRIVEKLVARKDTEVLIDPTMLLTSEEWDKVSKKPNQLSKIKEKKYILNYFLGELSETRKKEIERIAKENNCHVINILDKKDPFYKTGPSEFLYLEKNAFLICTDSFHSSVFGILYNTPFIVFEREDKKANMNSRIDTLLSKFKLENRKFNGKKITKENLNHDYTEAYKILKQERNKSKEFLKKALNVELR